MIYEGPYTSDPVVLKEWQDYGKLLHQAMESGDVDEMVMAFIGLVHAEDQVETLRKDKATWQKLSSLAPTLVYDFKVIGPTKGMPDDRLAKVKIPALILCGGDSGTEVIADTEHIASLIPHGVPKVLSGQSHSVEPAALVPVLQDFFF